MTSLPSVLTTCTPRDDVLQRAATADLYAANLNEVVRNRAPDVYQDPRRFFEETYPTDGLRTTIQEVFGRLAQQDARLS